MQSAAHVNASCLNCSWFWFLCLFVLHADTEFENGFRAADELPREKNTIRGIQKRDGLTRAFSNFCESRDSLGAANKILRPLQAEEAAIGYSNDLRVRVIRVVEGGVAARAAARQFVIGDATAIRWVKRWRETGSIEAGSVRGHSRSLHRFTSAAMDLAAELICSLAHYQKQTPFQNVRLPRECANVYWSARLTDGTSVRQT
jgi:transposase-like protein